MAYSIKNKDVLDLINEVARVKHKPVLEAIREACENELERHNKKVALYDRLQPVIEQFRKLPDTAVNADKVLIDASNGAQ